MRHRKACRGTIISLTPTPSSTSGYNPSMQNKFFPYIALAIGISALSLSAMFVRWADAPGAMTGFYRLLISTLLLTPFFFKQQMNYPAASGRGIKRKIFSPQVTGYSTH